MTQYQVPSLVKPVSEKMRQVFSGVITALVLTLAAQSAGAQGAVLTCPTLDKIENIFLNQHITYRQPSAELETRAIDQYVKRLDSTKIYLYESDVQAIKKSMAGVFGKMKKSDCSVLDKVQETYLKRVQERADYAKKVLSDKKFKFDPKTEIVLDPETRKYPKNKAEADAFQAKYLQFQVSNYLATGVSLDEAKKNVMKNYERSVKRVKDTSKEDLYSGYLDSFGRGLDPHSSYFSRDVLEDFEISMGLSLEGIGATLSSQDGFTVIEQLIDGGSAKASGQLLPQDKIVAVGQFDAKGGLKEMENVVEQDLRDVVRKIRGPKGTKVRLQILRKDADGPQRFVVDLVRDKIKLEDDAASLTFLDRDVNGEKKRVAVLNLPSFYADSKRGGRSSASDLKNLIKEAKAKAADAIVLDLSQNGGGSLDDAVKIAGLFFKTGAVVKQSSRDPALGNSTLEDRDPAVDWEGPMVVMTSRISASASEIVAGTLKDYQRAVVVGGDHTFGKGSVQSVVPLPPGLGAVKVTVGMFFTPGGFSTQHRGVEADIVFPGKYSTTEFGEKHLDYSLPPEKIPQFLSSDAYVPQGVGAWKRVEPGIIAALKQRSNTRVSLNSEFQKIQEEAKKSEQKAKVIKLADALKESKEKKSEDDQKKNQSKAEKQAEYLKRPEVQEAASVAADLLALQRGIVLTDAKVNPEAPQGDSTKTR